MKKHIAPNIFMTVLCLAFLICFAISAIVWFRPIYYVDINGLNIPALSGVSYDVCKLNYDVLIDYNMIWGPSTLDFPNFVMSATGAIHFAEVKTIFVNVQIIALVTGILMVICSIYCYRKKIYQWLRYTIVTAIVMVVAVVGLILYDWNFAFTFMHHMLFNNDYWLFDATTDPIITILPDQFFLHCMVGIVLICVIGLVICEVVYRKAKATVKQEQ